jgi:hypothetical protein
MKNRNKNRKLLAKTESYYCKKNRAGFLEDFPSKYCPWERKHSPFWDNKWKEKNETAIYC